MADRIKGITVEIGGDTKGLRDALSGVNKEINSTQSQLRDVERLLKLDPTNTQLLEQKQRLLSEAVEGTRTKLSALKDAEAQAQQQFAQGKISQEQYEGLQREIIATENSLKDLERQAANSNETLSKISEAADQVASGASKVASATKGLSTAAAGGVAALGALAVKAGLAADDLNTLAKQSGFSTEQIQQWQYAADRIDVSVEDIVGAAKKMKKNMISTSAETTGAWERLGISVRDGSGELRDSTAVFNETLQALSQVANETERDTLAMTLFGKSADSLAGIVDDGGAALNAMGQEAKDAGLILSQDALDGANAFNDGLDTLKAKAAGAAMSAGASLAENLLPVLDQAVAKVSSLLEWVASLDGAQLKTLGTVLLIIAAISPLAGLISGIATVVGVVTTVITTLSGAIAIFTGAATTGTAASTALAGAMSFLAANPIVLVIAAIAALVLALTQLWEHNENFRAAVLEIWSSIQLAMQTFQTWLDTIFATDWTTRFGSFGNIINGFFASVKAVWDGIRTAMGGVMDFIKGVFTGDWELAWQGVQDIFRGIFEALEGIAKAPINGIIALLNVAIDAINFFIRGLNKAISLMRALGINVPMIPEIGRIAYLAKGGILAAGSAIVGERGPELLSMLGGKAQVTPLTTGTRDRATPAAGEYHQTINIYGSPALSPAEVARQTRRATRQLVKQAVGT